MSKWEEYVRRVDPYVPGEQPKMSDVIKLNTNENPYPPAPGVAKALAGLDADKMRLYPDPECTILIDALAERYGVDRDQVFVGVGSDDVIAMAFQTFFNSDKPILFPDISYSFYPVWAELFGIPYETQRIDDDFRIVKEDYYKENGGVIFPNPNAPTSLLMGLDDVEDIIRHNQDSVVMVDEAYIDFAENASAMQLLDKYENLLVIQTFSKSRSMCGARIGFAIGSKKLIKCMNDVKFSFNSYTMNLPALLTGVESVKDQAYFEETVAKVKATRARTVERLAELGFTCPTPSANFVFAKHESCDAAKIFAKLKEKHIFVRYFPKPRIDQYLRITIGTDEQMDALFKALEEIV